jgi:hypothetical protein
MMQSMRATIVEMLLNSLEAERYVRGPLLCNIVDELSATDSYAPAASLATDLLVTLQSGPMSDEVFRARIDELRSCLRTRRSANAA